MVGVPLYAFNIAKPRKSSASLIGSPAVKASLIYDTHGSVDKKCRKNKIKKIKIFFPKRLTNRQGCAIMITERER